MAQKNKEEKQQKQVKGVLKTLKNHPVLGIKIDPQLDPEFEVMNTEIFGSFQTEMEFFLHYLWARRVIKDPPPTQYKEMVPGGGSIEKKQGAAKRMAQENKRKREQEFLSQDSMRFNFAVPQTVIIQNGQVNRWYYSDHLGHLKVRDEKNKEQDALDHFTQFCRSESQPAGVVFHKANEVIHNFEQDDETENINTVKIDPLCSYRDISCGFRLRQVLAQNPMPKSLDYVQEFIVSSKINEPTSVTPSSSIASVSCITPTNSDLSAMTQSCKFEEKIKMQEKTPVKNQDFDSQFYETYKLHFWTPKLGGGPDHLRKLETLEDFNKAAITVEGFKEQIKNGLIHYIVEKSTNKMPFETIFTKKGPVPNRHVPPYLNEVLNQAPFQVAKSTKKIKEQFTPHNLEYVPVAGPDRSKETLQIPLQMLYQSFEGGNFHGLTHSEPLFQVCSEPVKKQSKQPRTRGQEALRDQLLEAASLIFTQFKLNSIRLIEGCLYFVNGHLPPIQGQRNYNHASRKLHLVHAQDLAIWENQKRIEPFAKKRIIPYFDEYSRTFYQTITQHCREQFASGFLTFAREQENLAEYVRCQVKVHLDSAPEQINKLEPLLEVVPLEWLTAFGHWSFKELGNQQQYLTKLERDSSMAQKLQQISIISMFCYLLAPKNNIRQLASFQESLKDPKFNFFIRQMFKQGFLEQTGKDLKPKFKKLRDLYKNPRNDNSRLSEEQKVCPFCCREFTFDQLEQAYLPLQYLLVLRDQADFIRDTCEESHSKECLARLEGNFMSMAGEILPVGHIPDMIKILLPNLDKKHYNRVKHDQAWLDQPVMLCKLCYTKINDRFEEQLIQTERLNSVNASYQKAMLKMVQTNSPTKSFGSPEKNSPEKRLKLTSMTSRDASPEKQSFAEKYFEMMKRIDHTNVEENLSHFNLRKNSTPKKIHRQGKTIYSPMARSKKIIKEPVYEYKDVIKRIEQPKVEPQQDPLSVRDKNGVIKTRIENFKVKKDPLQNILYGEIGNRKLNLFCSQAKIHQKRMAQTGRVIVPEEEMENMRQVTIKRVSQASMLEGFEIGKNVTSLTHQLKRDLSQPLFRKPSKEEKQLLYVEDRASSYNSENEQEKRKEFDIHGRSYKELAHRIMQKRDIAQENSRQSLPLLARTEDKFAIKDIKTIRKQEKQDKITQRFNLKKQISELQLTGQDQKLAQTLNNIQMGSYNHMDFRVGGAVDKPQRRVSLRQRKFMEEGITVAQANQYEILKEQIAIHDMDLADVIEHLPQMAQAKMLMILEMRRLIHDPIFGQVNQSKIVNVEKRMKQKQWLQEDPIAQKILKELESKIKLQRQKRKIFENKQRPWENNLDDSHLYRESVVQKRIMKNSMISTRNDRNTNDRNGARKQSQSAANIIAEAEQQVQQEDGTEGLIRLKKNAEKQKDNIIMCTDLLERMDDIISRDELLKSRVVQVKKIRNFKATNNLKDNTDFMPKINALSGEEFAKMTEKEKKLYLKKRKLSMKIFDQVKTQADHKNEFYGNTNKYLDKIRFSLQNRIKEIAEKDLKDESNVTQSNITLNSIKYNMHEAQTLVRQIPQRKVMLNPDRVNSSNYDKFTRDSIQTVPTFRSRSSSESSQEQTDYEGCTDDDLKNIRNLINKSTNMLTNVRSEANLKRSTAKLY